MNKAILFVSRWRRYIGTLSIVAYVPYAVAMLQQTHPLTDSGDVPSLFSNSAGQSIKTESYLNISEYLVEHFEPATNVQRVYLDPAGIPTVCFGHTGKDVTPERMYSLQTCDLLLQMDLLKANNAINNLVHVSLNKYQRAALIDFVFNIGEGKFRLSTLLHKLNMMDYVGACDELPKWIYTKGYVLRGLERRRSTEKWLCLQH